MKQYVADVLASIEQKDPEQKMFHDTVSEVFSSIVPVLEAHPEYKEAKILERMVEPERTVSFRVAWQDDKGETHMSIGFSVYGLEKTPGNVLREAGNSVLYYGRIVFTSLVDLVRGRESINNLSGPVGIVSAIGQAASYGWQDLLELLALITVNLGILNLLPFPALDGGKVVFLVIEGVTGHAVPEKLQSVLTLATFGLLFGLMLFATYNDILRLITGTV